MSSLFSFSTETCYSYKWHPGFVFLSQDQTLKMETFDPLMFQAEMFGWQSSVHGQSL